jgi:hypothetical protein
MEDHTKETMKITTEGPEFEMPSHYMKEVVASVKTIGHTPRVLMQGRKKSRRQTPTRIPL